MSIWLPGYQRHVFPGRTGFAYADPNEPPKLCWHTTEGGSVAGALGAYAPYPPHAIANPLTDEKLQHISLDLTAYSAMDNNDVRRIIQFEIVGFAGSSHTWPEWVRKWLGENVVKPVRDAVGVPDTFLRFYGADEGITLASANSPIRLSASALRAFSGHLGHQHLSAPDSHWDPGRLPIADIIRFSQGDDDMNLNEQRVKVSGAPEPEYNEMADLALGAAAGNARTAAKRTGELVTKVDNLAAEVRELKASGVPVDVQLSEDDVERVAERVAAKLAQRLES